MILECDLHNRKQNGRGSGGETMTIWVYSPHNVLLFSICGVSVVWWWGENHESWIKSVMKDVQRSYICLC